MFHILSREMSKCFHWNLSQSCKTELENSNRLWRYKQNADRFPPSGKCPKSGMHRGSHYVDIIIGAGLLNDNAWLQRGEVVKNLGKSDYVICERSIINFRRLQHKCQALLTWARNIELWRIMGKRKNYRMKINASIG